jgi:hypothetical protein
VTEIPAGEVPTQPGAYWMLWRAEEDTPEQWMVAALVDQGGVPFWAFPYKAGPYQVDEVRSYVRVGDVLRIVGPIPEPDKVQR